MSEVELSEVEALKSRLYEKLLRLAEEERNLRRQFEEIQLLLHLKQEEEQSLRRFMHQMKLL